MTATYKAGTAAVSNGSVNVVGTGTAWAVALVVGGMFSCNGLSVPIASIVDDTHLTLDYPWPGTTGSGQSYSILRETSDAANMVDLYDKLSQLLVDLSLAGIHPDNSGSLTKRNALTLNASNDGYLYLRAELGVAFAFYRWDGPSLAWVGPFPVASATTTAAGVQSIVAGNGIGVDNTNPNIPVVALNIAGQAQGDILYRGSTTWQRLARGTALQVLRQNSALTAPEWVTAREVLTANRTYYVRTDGSDSNDGLANTNGGAFLTIQKAVDVASSLDLSIYSVTIQCADGAYASPVVMRSYVGAGPILIQGNVATPSNVTVALTSGYNFYASGVIGRYRIAGFKISNTGNFIAGIYAENSNVEWANMNFGSFSGTASFHIQAGLNAVMQSYGNYTISGGATAHLYMTLGALVRNIGWTITLTGTPAFANWFAGVASSSSLQINGNTFSGSAIGARYSVSANSVLDTNGAGVSYLPGNSAGAVATGGQYV